MRAARRVVGSRLDDELDAIQPPQFSSQRLQRGEVHDEQRRGRGGIARRLRNDARDLEFHHALVDHEREFAAHAQAVPRGENRSDEHRARRPQQAPEFIAARRLPEPRAVRRARRRETLNRHEIKAENLKRRARADLLEVRAARLRGGRVEHGHDGHGLVAETLAQFRQDGLRQQTRGCRDDPVALARDQVGEVLEARDRRAIGEPDGEEHRDAERQDEHEQRRLARRRTPVPQREAPQQQARERAVRGGGGAHAIISIVAQVRAGTVATKNASVSLAP